ncbi:hypothetical protein PV797_00515 [Clostridiaceae bacterium M8S5]|nr:hypothetical protein PV797_00515 [Clostridiaceae bacterium M8S5]
MKKFFVFLCVVCMMFSNMAFAVQSGGYAFFVENEYEGNNSLNTAVKVGTADNNINTARYTKIIGIVSQNDNEDWYKIKYESMGKGRFILYRMNGMDYDLYLYDKYGNKFSSSTNSGDRDEVIDNVYIKANEVYYIRIKYINGTGPIEPYRLAISVD